MLRYSPTQFFEEIIGGPENPIKLEWFHREWIYDQLNRDTSHTIRLCTRGAGKTEIGSVAYAVYRLAYNQNLRIIVASSTQNQANDIFGKIKKHIKSNPRLRWLFPELQVASVDEGGKDNASRLTLVRTINHKEQTVMAVGANSSSCVGMHCEILLPDDLIDEHNSESEMKMRKVIKWFETDLYPLVEPGGEVHIKGTPREEGDLYSEFMQTGEYDVKIYPAIANYKWDPEAPVPGKPGVTGMFTEGEPLWPFNRAKNERRFDLAELSRLRRIARSEFTFVTQRLCEYTTGERCPFKEEWLRYYDEDSLPNAADCVRAMAVDPAISSSEKAAHTAIFVASAYHDPVRGVVWYIEHGEVGQFSMKETARRIAVAASRYYPAIIGVEAIGYQSALCEEIKAVDTSLEGIIEPMHSRKGEGQHWRIEGLSGNFERSQVFLPKEAPWLEDFITQYKRYPNTSRIDQLDAMSRFNELFKDLKPPRRDDKKEEDELEAIAQEEYYSLAEGW